MENVFKVLVLIASWISQRDKIQQATTTSFDNQLTAAWIASISYIYENVHDRLFDADLSND